MRSRLAFPIFSFSHVGRGGDEKSTSEEAIVCGPQIDLRVVSGGDDERDLSEQIDLRVVDGGDEGDLSEERVSNFLVLVGRDCSSGKVRC